MNIDPAIQSGLLDPYINGTISTLRDMAACDAVPCETTVQPRWEARGDVTTLLGLSAAKPGVLVFSAPVATATKLAERLLAEAGIAVDDQLIRDSIGEIANVIGGQAKALAHGTDYAFNLTTPILFDGKRPSQFEGMRCYEIAWNSDLGDFSMFVCRRV